VRGRFQLGESEVQDLGAAVATEKQVVGLEIAMNDSLFMRRRQAASQLLRQGDGLGKKKSSLAQSCREGLTFEQFGYHVRRSAGFTDIEDGQDVGMIESGRGACLLLKAAQTIDAGGESGGQNLDGDVPSESRITATIDLAHATGTQGPGDLVRPNLGACQQ
jgi:hypothetical protein